MALGCRLNVEQGQGKSSGRRISAWMSCLFTLVSRTMELTIDVNIQ